MKIKWIKSVLTMVCLLYGFSASADGFSVDGIYYNITSSQDLTCGVAERPTSYYSGNMIIPEEVVYDGIIYKVTSIGDKAFYYCSGLTSITLPESVTSIGNEAFYKCSGLTNITLSESVTSIGSYAFSDCSGLTNIIIPESVTSIGSYAFWNCSSLTNITLPESVTSIGSYAFWNCSSLTNITLPESVTSIEGRVFSGCSGLTNITLPESVTSIGNGAFYYCSGLTNITLPESVTSIEGSVFSGCSGLTNIIIPESVTSIGSYAFQNCSSLTCVTIPNSVTSIGYGAFDGCSGLINITLPESVTSIGNYTFQNCSSLTCVTIPNSVTSIGYGAFDGCSGLASITVPESVISIGGSLGPVRKVIWLPNTPPEGYICNSGRVNYVSNDNYDFKGGTTYVYQHLSSMFESGGIVYVPVNPAERTCDIIDCSYSEAANTVNVGKTVVYKGISMNVLNVRPYAFYNNDFIKNLNISFKGVIPMYAFYSCENIPNVNLNNDITDIGDYAFYGCSSLVDATIANTGNIGNSAFLGCSSLTHATIENAGSIGASAFSGCSSLSSINLRNAGSIGICAFKDCSNVESLRIAPTVTYICDSVFYGCSQIGDVTIEEADNFDASEEVNNLNNIVTFPDWTSVRSNYYYSSSYEYSINIQAGDILSFELWSDYYYSDDKLEVFINGSSIATISGREKSQVFSQTFETPQIAILKVTYTNSSSTASKAGIRNIRLLTNPNPEWIRLGSNGSSPLFSSCALDEVFIGRKLSYNTSSGYGYSPFYRNTSLRAVTITDKETMIYDNEFYGCTGLKSIKVGDGVTSFGKYAFSGCFAIESLEFGAHVESIGEEAFSDCTGLKTIISHNPVPPVCGTEALDDINKWECTLYIPDTSMEAYKAADQWKNFFFFENYDPTGITPPVTTENKPEEVARYDMSGNRVTKDYKGIVIIRYADGTRAKVLNK